MSGAPPKADREMARVRLAARAGALVIAALFYLVALKPFSAPVAGGHDEAGVESISVDLSPEAPAAPEKPPPVPRPRGVEIANAAPPASETAPGDALDLWVDQSGHLLFNSAEKYRAYRRCIAAHGGHASADCPAPTASDSNPPIALARRVSHGWR